MYMLHVVGHTTSLSAHYRPALLREWGCDSHGPLSKLLRWTHPRVVQPALDLVRDRIDLSHLPRLGVEQETWRALLDFDSSESPPRLSLRHLIWHTADVAITPPRTSPNSSPGEHVHAYVCMYVCMYTQVAITPPKTSPNSSPGAPCIRRSMHTHDMHMRRPCAWSAMCIRLLHAMSYPHMHLAALTRWGQWPRKRTRYGDRSLPRRADADLQPRLCRGGRGE